MQPKIVNNLVPPGANDWTPGREGHKPEYIVLHTTDSSRQSAEVTFANGKRKASAHRIVGLDGSISVEVADGDTAWGADNWPVNLAAFNLEHEDNGNPNDSVRTPQEYEASAWQVADWCRRFGIPCEHCPVDPATHMPTKPGIVWHKEVSQDPTACPDGLDVERIISQAQQLLGGTAPQAVEASAAVVPGVTPWGPKNVRVMVQNLRVHKSASTADAGNFANTPDGLVHLNNLVMINGWVRGQLVSQGGQTSDVWLHDTFGRFLWAPDTDFFLAAPDVPMETPVPQNNFTPQAANGLVTPSNGANLRRDPHVATDNLVKAVPQGTILNLVGFTTDGGSVAGDTHWQKTDDDLWVSNEVIQVTPHVPQGPQVNGAGIDNPPTAPSGVSTTSTSKSMPVFRSTGTGEGIKGDITPPSPAPGFQAAPVPGTVVAPTKPMSLRDYVVAGLAKVLSPFAKKK